MADDSIQRLIDGRYPDPDSGELLGVPIRRIAIEHSIDGHEGDLVKDAGLSGRLAVVSDPSTHTALGSRVARRLSAGAVVPVLLQEHPHADQVTADRLAAQTEHCDALIAVGSGTINDLCKYVAARAAKPYAVFATAPSMNGYTSANAAISIDGHKKTLPAVSPTGVFIDLAVLTAAPARLIRAGLGDSSCRSTAQIDWLLSHHLLGTPYRRAPFDLLAGDERGLLAEPNALMRRDLDAMRRLARTLVLSGLGMTLCGGSYPASQGEHLISHYIDMMAARERAPFHHGEQVAVTTLTMARLQQRMLASERPPALGLTPATRADLVAHYGPQVGDACWRELEPKMLSTREAVDRMNERLAKRWGAIVHACESVVIGHHLLEATLAAAQAPIAPESIALDTNFYAGAVRHARELRNRYTFLDLAADAADLPER